MQCMQECLSFKEVIHPHLPVRVPCYDLVPLTPLTFGRSLLAVGPRTSGEDNSGDLTGGVYKTRERIQRSIADLRLLAIPPSYSRVADCNLKLGRIFGICQLISLWAERCTSNRLGGLDRSQGLTIDLRHKPYPNINAKTPAIVSVGISHATAF